MKTSIFYTLLVIMIFELSYGQEKKVKINGRIQFDYEFLKRENSNEWFNGNEFRRVYISFKGKLSEKLSYKVETNFANASIHFNDMYIKYNAGKYGTFGVGSIVEPNGLNIGTSSKYISFLERSMLTTMQNGRWGAGLHYENFTLLDGKLGFQMAMTNNGSAATGFKDLNLEIGQNFVTRLTFVPIMNKKTHTLMHFGLNYANRPAKKLSFRAENHMGDKYAYNFPGAKKRNVLGLELAAGYQSLSLQAEYKSMKLTNDFNLDYNISSYYAFVSYFVTGEHRPYKRGAFGRVKPKKDVFKGGSGAIEVLARYSNLTPSNDVIISNPLSPKQVNNLSFGLNWYLNAHTRIMYNYVITDDKNNLLGKQAGHLLRVHIDF